MLATSLVPRLQWLNLGRVGWWGRPALCAAAAGALVAAFRRDDRRAALVGGALAGLLSLWSVYAIVRLSVRVLFVDESAVAVIARDLGVLALWSAPPALAAAAAVWFARAR